MSWLFFDVGGYRISFGKDLRLRDRIGRCGVCRFGRVDVSTVSVGKFWVGRSFCALCVGICIRSLGSGL